MRGALVFLLGACGRVGFGPPNVDSSFALTCPAEYLPVPAHPEVGAIAFCASKYEARSASDGEPLRDVNQQMAQTRCASLGAQYALMSSNEAMAIARDIESVGENWSSGMARVGLLAKGHSDYDPSRPLPAADDTDPCFMTNDVCSPTAWHLQRRTFVLTNREIIWDFSGNAQETLDWLVVTDRPGGAGWEEVNALGPTAAMPVTSFRSADESLTDSANEIGEYYSGTDGMGGAAARGGSYYDSSHAGVYTLRMDSAPDRDESVSTDSGFRCVYRP